MRVFPMGANKREYMVAPVVFDCQDLCGTVVVHPAKKGVSYLYFFRICVEHSTAPSLLFAILAQDGWYCIEFFDVCQSGKSSELLFSESLSFDDLALE